MGARGGQFGFSVAVQRACLLCMVQAAGEPSRVFSFPLFLVAMARPAPKAGEEAALQRVPPTVPYVHDRLRHMGLSPTPSLVSKYIAKTMTLPAGGRVRKHHLMGDDWQSEAARSCIRVGQKPTVLRTVGAVRVSRICQRFGGLSTVNPPCTSGPTGRRYGR